MILLEFPDLRWLKEQIKTRFERKQRWDGKMLAHTGWPNVLLHVKTGEIYRDRINGPFSLFGNISGTSWVTVDHRKVRVDQDHFFISNQGQEYTLAVEKEDRPETFNIHFGEHFADEAIQSFCDPHYLLENPFTPSQHPFIFHNRLLRKTPAIQTIIRNLQQNSDTLYEEESLLSLFRILLNDEQQLKSTEQNLSPVKKATREEILKRILLSVDYIYCFYPRSISLEELAQASCLSKFHFLRLFGLAMGKTPHQFITQVRLQKAKDLLHTGNREIHQIAQAVGFSNASSFSRLFYHQTGVYPSHFRA